jgi:hypothetical protein
MPGASDSSQDTYSNTKVSTEEFKKRITCQSFATSKRTPFSTLFADVLLDTSQLWLIAVDCEMGTRPTNRTVYHLESRRRTTVNFELLPWLKVVINRGSHGTSTVEILFRYVI